MNVLELVPFQVGTRDNPKFETSNGRRARYRLYLSSAVNNERSEVIRLPLFVAPRELTVELPRFGGRLTTWDYTTGWEAELESRRDSSGPVFPRKRSAPSSASRELFAA